VDAYPFGLDLVYLHMDLNVKVRSAPSVPLPFLIQRIDPACGNVPPPPHGTDIICNTLKMRSLKTQCHERRLTGIGQQVMSPRLRALTSRLNSFHIDAHDIYGSPFFDNSSSGVGGWGDPNNDYQIYTGGFKDEIRAYPSPHHIRRNFSLYPFSNPDLLPPFAGDPAAPPSPVDLMINTTMTKENVDYVVNFEGDFFGFHAYAESTVVSLTSRSLFLRPS
jgi:hypothetical protein